MPCNPPSEWLRNQACKSPGHLLPVLPVSVLCAQVKKRGRWLHRFSLDVLSKLPGTADDPFEGVTVDTNSLGKHPLPFT
jgi:hypothetical protein